MSMRHILAATAICVVALAGAAQAAEPDSCKKVRMADVGWTDNTAQNGLFNTVAKPLGYHVYGRIKEPGSQRHAAG